jgi:polyvinyl alcohol dehydrogenase (cytochrome)
MSLVSLVAAIVVATVATSASAYAAPGAASSSSSSPAQWPMFGQNYHNTANGTTDISVNDVASLKPKWVFTTSGDVSARAAVVNQVAYFPDWGGNVYAVKASNGKLIWKKNILADYVSGLSGISGTEVVSVTSPAVDVASNTLYLGTQTGGYLLAINASTGNLKWATQLDSHGYATDTASPIVYNGVVYVGVASNEDKAAESSSYPCCSFRGSAVALSSSTGKILWKTYTVSVGYSGGAVTGPMVPDPTHNLVYVTTGNNYSLPTDSTYASCITSGGTASSCLPPDDHFDSVLALNMTSGAIAWGYRLSNWNQPQYGISDGSDFWNYGCIYGSTNCPTVAVGPEYNFDSGVNLFTIQTGSGPRTIVGAGQKSGIYVALEPATGARLWSTQVGPGSSLGGIEWGSATDGQRIYVAISDFYGIPYQAGSAGSWAALDPATGTILWQTKDPNGSVDLGPMTVANGVVYAPSMAGGSTSPNMFALNAATGAITWSYAAGGSVIAGASIAYDTVYWGSGYSELGTFLPFTGNNKFYAFSLGGQ